MTPVEQTTCAAMVNGAIHSFVKAVALEIKKGIRVNIVSTGGLKIHMKNIKIIFQNTIPIQ